MKESTKMHILGNTEKAHISKRLYVQVEERLNLRRVLSLGRDLMTMESMACKVLGKEGKNHGFQKRETI